MNTVDVPHVPARAFVTEIEGKPTVVNPLRVGSRFPIYIGSQLTWHWVIGASKPGWWHIRREAKWPAPDAQDRVIVLPCEWAGCRHGAVTRYGYWGQYHWLCAEHGDLVGDDGFDG